MRNRNLTPGQTVGYLFMAILGLVFFVAYKSQGPQNVPPGKASGTPTAQVNGSYRETHYVAPAPHWDNPVGLGIALAIPAIIVISLIVVLVRKPEAGLTPFVGGAFACGLLGVGLWFIGQRLQTGERGMAPSTLIPMFEMLGATLPAYIMWITAGVSAFLGIIRMLTPCPPGREEGFNHSWN